MDHGGSTPLDHTMLHTMLHTIEHTRDHGCFTLLDHGCFTQLDHFMLHSVLAPHTGLPVARVAAIFRHCT